MFEKQAQVQRREEEAVKDLQYAIIKLEKDARNWETLLHTLVSPDIDSKPVAALCNSIPGKAALSQLEEAFSVAALLLQQNERSHPKHYSQLYMDKKNAIAKRPSIRDLISSFLKANFTLDDGTVDNMRDAAKDLDMCRKDCKRAWNMFWHLYMIYHQQHDASRQSNDDSPPPEKSRRQRRKSHDSIFEAPTPQRKKTLDMAIQEPMPRRRNSHDSIFPKSAPQVKEPESLDTDYVMITVPEVPKPAPQVKEPGSSDTNYVVPMLPKVPKPAPQVKGLGSLTTNDVMPTLPKVHPLRLRRVPPTTQVDELESLLREILLDFNEGPFSKHTSKQAGEILIKFGNKDNNILQNHQRKMKELGEAWVKERTNQESFKDATGKVISKHQQLGELQNTILELLWSHTIERANKHHLQKTGFSWFFARNTRKCDFGKDFDELGETIQKIVLHSKHLTITFCGTVASGKSNFLNAFIGDHILPSSELDGPGMAWPYRIKHVAGQALPVLTHDDRPFTAGIQELQRVQYSKKMKNYQPTSYSAFEHGKTRKQGNTRDLELREIYVSWINLSPGTRQNLEEFEQSDFRLPRRATGREKVQKLLAQLNDIVELCYRFKLDIDPKDAELPLLSLEFKYIPGDQKDITYELIDLPSIGGSFEVSRLEPLLQLAAKNSDVVVPIISCTELDSSYWRTIPDIVARSFKTRANAVVCTDLDQILGSRGMSAEESEVSVSKVFWPRMATDNQRAIACSPQLGLSARQLLDLSRNGKPQFEDILDPETKKLESPCAKAILGTDQLVQTFELMGAATWCAKLEKILEDSRLSDALTRLTKALLTQKKPRLFLSDSDTVCKQIRKVNLVEEEKLFNIKDPRVVFEDSKREYTLARAKILEFVDLWVAKESQQRNGHIDRLDSLFKALQPDVDGLITHAVKKALEEDQLGTLKQETVERRPILLGKHKGGGRTEKTEVTILVVESTNQAEKLLLVSQNHFHDALRKHQSYYVNGVRELADAAGMKRLRELKEMISGLDPKIKPMLRRKIERALERLSSDIRQVISGYVDEQVKLKRTRRQAGIDLRLPTETTLPDSPRSRKEFANTINAREEAISRTMDDLGFMLRSPSAPLGSIPCTFSLSTLPWTVQSAAFHLSMDVLQKKYKIIVFGPWWNSLREEAEKSLMGTIQISSSVAKAAVQSLLEEEDKQYTYEEEQKASLKPALTVNPYTLVVNSNLWAAESALLLIQKMLKVPLPSRVSPSNRI